MKLLNFAGCMMSGFLLLGAMPAWATLGDNAASVLRDQAHMKGALHSVDNRSYVLHEITLSTGAKVREYVSPAGAVFGVAWEGQFAPDFQQLLGTYFPQAQQAIAQQKSQEGGTQAVHRRAPVVLQTPGLVLVHGGHVRSFHGVAYIPQLIPSGVNAADIR